MHEVTLKKCEGCEFAVFWERNTCNHPDILKRLGRMMDLDIDPVKTVPEWCPRKAEITKMASVNTDRKIDAERKSNN